MPKKVKCSDCGYLCVEETKNVFLGDRTIIEARQDTSAWRHAEYETEKQYLEITPQNREDPTDLKESAEDIFCYRHAFSLTQEMKSLADGDLSVKFKTVVQKSRECEYHIKYIPGYSPVQHLMRWENLQTQQANRRWNLLYMVIGSAITILGALAIKLIFG